MKNVSFTEEMLAELRSKVSERLSKFRFEHTLGVERAAAWLGELILPERVMELRAAAILHDVAKELDPDEQLDLIHSCSRLRGFSGCSAQVLHSFSGVAVIIRDFSEYATDDILNAVMYHTLGDPAMNIFAEIIYLADYIEDGRAYRDCKEVREALKYALSTATSAKEREKCLHTSVIDTIDRTVRSVRARGYEVDERTLKAKNAILDLI